MSKYIDADELIKTLNREGVPFNEDVNYFILHAPAADVTEVKHGRWLMTNAYPHKVYCSECYATLIPNVEWFKTYNIASTYCPNCGALMVNEDE